MLMLLQNMFKYLTITVYLNAFYCLAYDILHKLVKNLLLPVAERSGKKQVKKRPPE